MKHTIGGHQGDILIEHLDTAPDLSDYTEETAGEMVVATGESSGHRHRVSGERVRFFRAPDGLSCVVFVEEAAMLVHDHVSGARGDHNPHGLASGWTRLYRQREASLDEAGWRAVTD
jgi:hypothetical protein